MGGWVAWVGGWVLPEGVVCLPEGVVTRPCRPSACLAARCIVAAGWRPFTLATLAAHPHPPQLLSPGGPEAWAAAPGQLADALLAAFNAPLGVIAAPG